MESMTVDQPVKFAEIPAAIPLEELKKDLATISESGLVASQGDLDVYIAPAENIPGILLEIGRLREVTFRAVGEGTGKDRDLDHHDDLYLHLFLWDREEERIAGAYRLACTDEIFQKHGFAGLYTATLCECDQALLDYLNPALELGRSWIRPEYQKSLHSLLGLWKGIGQFVARNPRYHKLFGAVSISDDYTSISQNLIVRYLRRTATHPTWSDRIRALLPFRDKPEALSSGLKSIDEVSAEVSSNEPDGKGVPVLLRQYFKMNATLLDFAYDPNFMHCLDALVLVDLKEAPARLLKKYMGKEGYENFRSQAEGKA